MDCESCNTRQVFTCRSFTQSALETNNLKQPMCRFPSYRPYTPKAYECTYLQDFSANSHIYFFVLFLKFCRIKSLSLFPRLNQICSTSVFLKFSWFLQVFCGTLKSSVWFIICGIFTLVFYYLDYAIKSHIHLAV